MAHIGEIISLKCSFFNWEIKNFSNLSSLNGSWYFSPNFVDRGSTWELTIYPNGYDAESDGFISLYLTLKDAQFHALFIDYQISIIDEDGTYLMQKQDTKTIYKSNQVGWERFLERSELMKEIKQVASKDILMISCILCPVSVENEPESAIPQSDSIRLMPSSSEAICCSLKDLFLKKRNCDIIILVQGHVIPAHKTILIARSKVFAAMFEHEMKENQESKVKIDGFQPDDVSNFLLYIYSGGDNVITSENVFKLYALSHIYDIEDLLYKCVEFMRRNLTIASICDIIVTAENYNDSRLKRLAKGFLTRNAKDVFSSDNWEVFSEANSSLAHEITRNIILDNAFKLKM